MRACQRYLTTHATHIAWRRRWTAEPQCSLLYVSSILSSHLWQMVAAAGLTSQQSPLRTTEGMAAYAAGACDRWLARSSHGVRAANAVACGMARPCERLSQRKKGGWQVSKSVKGKGRRRKRWCSRRLTSPHIGLLQQPLPHPSQHHQCHRATVSIPSHARPGLTFDGTTEIDDGVVYRAVKVALAALEAEREVLL